MSSIMRRALGQTTGLYSDVLFDPILTPLFIGIFGTGGITIGATTFAYASIATAIASTAITFGLQYLLAPKPPKAESGRAPKTQGDAYRIYGVGTNRIGGQYMLWEAKNNVLAAVVALAGHQISAVKQFYLLDRAVSVVSGVVQTPKNPMYSSGIVTLDSRIGLPTETPYANIVSLFAGDNVWTNNHRGDGQASLAMTCAAVKQKNFSKAYPNGVPQPSAVLDMALVWDFRDQSQSPDDPSTWRFSKNPALQLCWHECFNPFGMKRDYRKTILPVLDQWVEEANICDELVVRASGGTEKRYECNVWATSESEPKSVSMAIKASCDGWTCERGDGALILIVGKFRESLVATITDNDIVGHYIQNDVAEEDEINRLVPQFTYPATDYTTTTTDYYESTADQLISGRVLSQPIELVGIQNWRQARRVAKRHWLRIQEKRRGSFDIRLSGLNAIYSRWVRVSSKYRIPRLDGIVIENMRSTVSLQRAAFQLEWVQNPKDIDAWTPEIDEGLAPPVPVEPGDTAVTPPTIDSITVLASGGSTRLKVNITDPISKELDVAIHYRTVSAGPVYGEWIEKKYNDWVLSGGLIKLETDAVPPNQTLQVEAAFIGTTGAYTAWSAPATTVVSTADPVATGPVTALNKTTSTGTINLTWTTPSEANFRSVLVKYNTTNTEVGAILLPFQYLLPASAGAKSITGLTAGNYYVFVYAQNASEVQSTVAATGVIAVP